MISTYIYAVATANGNFATLSAGPGPGVQGQQQYGQSLLANCSYYILSSSGTPGTATFQELGADGTWRALVVPAPLTLVNGNPQNNPIYGLFHGLRVAITAASATSIYIELFGQLM